MSQEIRIMSKELLDAPVTEVTEPCPCCGKKLIATIRVAGDQIAYGLQSEEMRSLQLAILEAVDRSTL